MNDNENTQMISGEPYVEQSPIQLDVPKTNVEQAKTEEKIPLWKQLGRKKPGPAPGSHTAKMAAKKAAETKEKKLSVGVFGGNPVQHVVVASPRSTSSKMEVSVLKQMASIYNRAVLELVSPKWNNREQQVSRDTIALMSAMRDAFIGEVQVEQPYYDPARTGRFD